MTPENQTSVKMTKSQVGRLGALARMKKYGNPGTLDGRRKGGLHSIETHKKLKTGFLTGKEFTVPENSEDLAEFMGIWIGDGHLAKYQASMCTSSKTDRQHAKYVQALAKKLFNIKVSLHKKKDCNALNVVISSIGLVEWLKTKGMPGGNKMSALCIPDWIKENVLFSKKFLRGLFDTDGCVFIDTHIIREKQYQSRGWTITSYSAKLRNELVTLLQNLGFQPTLRNSQVSVYMRRKNDIKRYFQEIGTSNEKHAKRYARKIQNTERCQSGLMT